MNIWPDNDLNNITTITTNKIPETILKTYNSNYTIHSGASVDDLEDKIDQLKETINKKLNITMLHGCRNCGAQIDCDIDKPVFHCKYCGTTYVIGNVQINSTY